MSEVLKQLFSNDKAQELVDAIKNINPNGHAEISDSVKRALLSCFQNVAWINQQGQSLYNSLYSALYSDVQPIPGGDGWYYGYKNDGTGNAIIGHFGTGCKSVDGVYRGLLGDIVSDETPSNRRALYLSSGVYPILNLDNEESSYYPIPIPENATKFILDTNESLLCRCVITKYTNEHETYKYVQIVNTSSAINQAMPYVYSFEADENLYLTMYIAKSDNTNFEEEPEISLMFE